MSVQRGADRAGAAVTRSDSAHGHRRTPPTTGAAHGDAHNTVPGQDRDRFIPSVDRDARKAHAPAVALTSEHCRGPEPQPTGIGVVDTAAPKPHHARRGHQHRPRTHPSRARNHEHDRSVTAAPAASHPCKQRLANRRSRAQTRWSSLRTKNAPTRAPTIPVTQIHQSHASCAWLLGSPQRNPSPRYCFEAHAIARPASPWLALLARRNSHPSP